MQSIPSHTTSSVGFTMIELMVAVAIIGILAAVATPSLRDAMLNYRMVAQVNDTLTDLNIARSEAVKRNSSVSLCPSADGATCSGGTNWANGWIVFADPDQSGTRAVASEDLIKATPALKNTNPNALGVLTNANTPTTSIIYTASGGTFGGAQSIVFTFCDSRAGTTAGSGQARQITINVTGRPVFTRITCNTP